MPSYKEKSGKNSECLSIDSEQILSELSKGKFAISTKANTYSPEECTFNYIKGIFNVLKKIEKSWEECKNHAGNYIKDFEDIPEAKSVVDDTAEYLDASEVLGIGSVTASSLNIRSGAGTGSNIIGLYKSGDKIEILGYSEDGKWIKVKTPDGQDGYIANKYVTVEKAYPMEDNKVSDTPQSEAPIETLDTNEEAKVEEPKQEVVDNNVKESVEKEVKMPDEKDVKESVDIKKDNIDETQNASKFGKITASSLNIRSEAGMDSKVIGWYNSGDEVEVTGVSENGKWLQVKTPDGQVGYISNQSKYVTVDEGSIPKATTSNQSSVGSEVSTSTKVEIPANTQTAIINTKNHRLNFRAGASINSEIYGSIPRGTKIEVLDYDSNSNWVEVSYNGQKGYVYKEFIKLEGDNK